MKRYPGPVTPEHLKLFPSQFPENLSFRDYVSNVIGLEGFLACVGLLSPSFVEYENLVLLEDLLQNRDPKNHLVFGGATKTEIEQFNNLISLCDFFYKEKDPSPTVDELFYLFGGVLKTYWKLRLEQVFPSREFNVVLDYNILGEEGLCITFYELYPGCGSPPEPTQSWIKLYGDEVDPRYHYPNEIDWLNLSHLEKEQGKVRPVLHDSGRS